jgi:UDP-2,3-diacylglucosamine pyrophosphatase LpxH
MLLAASNNESGPAKRIETNDVYLISDLHLADGRATPFGKFTQGENFFWDESFQRFLQKIATRSNGRSQTLIINGDFLDFLRVCRIPFKREPDNQGFVKRWFNFLRRVSHIPSERESDDRKLVERWLNFLVLIDHPARANDLYAAVKSEKTYGFRTNDYKCIWKLLLMFEGHKVFFNALRSFTLRNRNQLLIIKGNHDLEFHWEAVRQAFVFFLAREKPQAYKQLNPRIHFFQQSVVINNELHIEHGHLYERMTCADTITPPDNPDELLLPAGSLFNRYVINKLEAIEPLFDNIKPPTSILKAVAMRHPRRILTIVFRHFIGACKIIRKAHPRFAGKIFWKVLSLSLPIIVGGILLAGGFYYLLQSAVEEPAAIAGLTLVASFLSGVIVRGIQNKITGIDEPSSLLSDAQRIFKKNHSLKLITFGHTHASEMSPVADDCWYVNSGTWIPHVDVQLDEVQDKDTFCVLRILNDNGTLRREPLLRWDDQRDELERMIVMEKPAAESFTRWVSRAAQELFGGAKELQ